MAKCRKYHGKGLFDASRRARQVDDERIPHGARPATGQHAVRVLTEGDRPHRLGKSRSFALNHTSHGLRGQVPRPEAGTPRGDHEVGDRSKLDDRCRHRFHTVLGDAALDQRRGWSLNRVAAGIAPYLGQMGASTISSWENSRTDGAKGFTIEEIFALCRVFEITIAELLAAPRILDIGDPIERIAGEEPPIDIAKVFVGTGRDDLRNSWRRYSSDGSIEYGPDEAPF